MNLEQEVVVMASCPNCKKTISSLKLLETKEQEYDVTYDEEAETLEVESCEEWHGNQLGSIIKQVYSCPECYDPLFNDEQEAKAFFKESEKSAKQVHVST